MFFSFLPILALGVFGGRVFSQPTIYSAIYGKNCATQGDETQVVQSFCATHSNASGCNFLVCACGQPAPCTSPPNPCFPDPSDGCSKDFSAQWACPGDTANKTLHINGESGFGSPAVFYCGDAPPPPEPWAPLSGGGFTGPARPLSPDPLVQYVWPPGSFEPGKLQMYTLPPQAVSGSPPTAFPNASAAGGGVDCSIAVVSNGTLVIDFGIETPGWLEITTEGLPPGDVSTITMSTGEGNLPTFVGAYKTAQPTVYGPILRLETNGELYEGVRYGFLTLTTPPSTPWRITAIRLRVQARPVNYGGSFSASGDPLLERIWYTGAYTIRALLRADYMGSVLVDRGDRISWTGDAFVSESTFMAAFTDASIVRQNLNVTSCLDCCQGIATYCLLFVLSAINHWRSTGDATALSDYQDIIVSKLETALQRYPSPTGLRFVGWDDRTGSGFANNTTPETQAMYRMLAIRCWREFGAAAGDAGGLANATLAARYTGLAAAAIAELRNSSGGGVWWQGWGVHAGGEALNAGFLTPSEASAIYASTRMHDIVILPSLSHFNQYFLLCATSAYGALDRGAEQVRQFWGADLALGGTTFFEVGHPGLVGSGIPLGGPPPIPGEQNGWTLLCADWSTGAVQWLSSWILGIRPATPGFKRAIIAPHLPHSMAGASDAAAAATATATAASLSGSHPVPGGVPITMNLTLGVAGVEEGGDCAVLAVTLPPACSDGGVVQLSSKTLARVFASKVGGMGLSHLTLTSLAAMDAQLHTLTVSVVSPTSPSTSSLAATVVTTPSESPLLDERSGDTGEVGVRCRAVQVELPAPGDHVVRVCPGPGSAAAKQLLGGVIPTEDGTQGGTTPTSTSTSASASAALPLLPPYDPPSWPGRFIASDWSTAGSWKGVFGGDGYAFFTFGGALNASGDLVSLPPYVESVVVVGASAGFLGERVSWVNASTCTPDPRALQHPTDPNCRALGAVSSLGGATFPIDITLTPAARAANTRFRLSVYCVDFGPTPWGSGSTGEARSQELASFTGYPDLNPLTPRQYLADFQGGVWMSYEVSGSLRFRVSTIRGDMGVLSAIAFDAL